MAKELQMWADENKTIKGYPKTKAESVYTNEGKKVENELKVIKTNLDNITTNLNGYKFVDAPSEGEKDLYMQEFDTGIIQTKEDNRINGIDKNLVSVINTTKESIENHITNHPSGGEGVGHTHTNQAILNTIVKENRYVTSDEYIALTDDEKNNASIVWNIINNDSDVLSLSLNGNNLNLLRNGEIISTVVLSGLGGGETITYGNIVISKSSTTINEGETDMFTVELDKQPSQEQTVNISSNNSDLILSHTELTFTTSDWNVPQTISIGASEDTDYNDEVGVVTLSSTNVPSKTITINIIDNDEAPVGGTPITNGRVIQLDAVNFERAGTAGWWGKTDEETSVQATNCTKSGSDVHIPNTKLLNIIDLTSHTNYTLELMLKNNFKNQAATRIPFGTGTYAGAIGVSAIVRSTNTIEIKSFKNSTSSSTVSLGGYNDEYLHFVITVDGTNKTARMAINGVFCCDVVITTDFVGTFALNCGNASMMMDIYARTLRAYNRILTNEEITNNYNYELLKL